MTTDGERLAALIAAYERQRFSLRAGRCAIRCARCGAKICPGAEVWRHDAASYCSPQCVANAIGAEPLEYGDDGYLDLFPVAATGESSLDGLKGLAERENSR